MLEQFLEEATYNDEGDLTFTQEAVDRMLEVVQAAANEANTRLSQSEAGRRTLQATYVDCHNDLNAARHDLGECRQTIEDEKRLKEDALERIQNLRRELKEAQAAVQAAEDVRNDAQVKMGQARESERAALERLHLAQLEIKRISKEQGDTQARNVEMALQARKHEEALRRVNDELHKQTDATAKAMRERDEARSVNADLTDRIDALKAAADPVNQEAEIITLQTAKECALKELDEARSEIAQLKELNANQRESLDAAIDSEDVGRNDALELVATLAEEIVTLNHQLRIARKGR